MARKRITDKFRKHGFKKDKLVKTNGYIKYRHKTGMINVLYMCRYPNVEYVFGIPARGHKYYKDEWAFFEIRGKDREDNWWCLIDKNEMLDWACGFSKLAYHYFDKVRPRRKS
jgi:hypothetical protein